jgi:hypothetical protein
MGLGQVEGMEGVGRGVVNLIRLGKRVEKSKAPGAKPPGAPGGGQEPGGTGEPDIRGQTGRFPLYCAGFVPRR